MRTFTIAIFIFLLSNPTFSQTTSIPDANFENYLENNRMGDGIPNNQLVLTSNINTVTDLNLQGIGIADLTGIEDFAMLEFLNCGMNGLTTLDVSQNQMLEQLGCDFNALTSLDLSSNVALRVLYCPVNNLTSLNLTENINLEIVYCTENFITNLIITSPELLELYCSFNLITNLDLSSSPLLTIVSASYNRLTNVNFTENPLLYDLGVSENNLTNVDVSQITNLTYFGCSNNSLQGLDLSQNFALQVLTAVDNNLENLDLSQNINLENLRVYQNPQMSSLDIRNGNNQGITFFDATNPNLKCIYVDDSSAPFLENWIIGPNTTFVNNEKECALLANNENDENLILIFPNPVKNTVHILGIENGTFTVTNQNGQILLSGILSENITDVDLFKLSSGLYFLTVYSTDGNSTKKIMKL